MIIPLFVYKYFYGNHKSTENIGRVYSNEIQPISILARNICKDWSKSTCSTAKDMIPFLEKYKKLKEMDDLQGIKEIPQIYRNDFQMLEEYRVKTMSFWLHEVCSVNEFSMMFGFKRKINMDIMDYVLNPTEEDIIEFLTFHSAMYRSVKKNKTVSMIVYSLLRSKLTLDQSKIVSTFEESLNKEN